MYVYRVFTTGYPFEKQYYDLLTSPAECISNGLYIFRTNNPSRMEDRLNTDHSVESYTVKYPGSIGIARMGDK